MTCRYCGRDSNDSVLIPESPELADIRQSAFACLYCAIERGIFCQRHQRVHQAFARNKHACWLCIDANRHALSSQKAAISTVCSELKSLLPVHVGELFFEEGGLELIPVLLREPTPQEILSEFLAREIAIQEFDIHEFIRNFLTGTPNSQEVGQLIMQSANLSG